MWKCLSKYVCIFLLLTLSGVFFLFRNISILEVRRKVIFPQYKSKLTSITIYLRYSTTFFPSVISTLIHSGSWTYASGNYAATTQRALLPWTTIKAVTTWARARSAHLRRLWRSMTSWSPLPAQSFRPGPCLHP